LAQNSRKVSKFQVQGATEVKTCKIQTFEPFFEGVPVKTLNMKYTSIVINFYAEHKNIRSLLKCQVSTVELKNVNSDTGQRVVVLNSL